MAVQGEPKKYAGLKYGLPIDDFPCMHDALSSIPGIKKGKRKKATSIERAFQ